MHVHVYDIKKNKKASKINQNLFLIELNQHLNLV